MSKSISVKTRRLVVERARGLCEYCRTPERYSTVSFAVEHIVPQSNGGESSLENLALSCQECNNHKYTKTHVYDATAGDSIPLFHPRQHRWSTHFMWNDDFTLLVGVSPIGRATIETLQLNRSGVVNLRRVLFTANEHPPADES